MTIINFIEVFLGYCLDNVDKNTDGMKIVCKSKVFEISSEFLPDKGEFEKLFDKLVAKLYELILLTEFLNYFEE